MKKHSLTIAFLRDTLYPISEWTDVSRFFVFVEVPVPIVDHVYVLNVLNQIFGHVLGALPQKEQHRRGGYICITERSSTHNPNPIPLLVADIGVVDDPKKAAKYFALSQEKAARLIVHPSHDSSWQSRNPDADQWGGAVVASSWIFSFSGFPEAFDEAVMLLLAQKLKHIDAPTARHIAGHSNNIPFFSLQFQLGLR